MKRSLLLSAFFAFFFATAVIAQDRPTTEDGDPSPTETTTDRTTDRTTGATTTTTTPTTGGTSEADTTTTDEDTTTTENTTTADETSERTTTTDETSERTTTTDETSRETSTAATTTTRKASTAPPLTTTTSRESVPPLPTLAGQYSYPPPTVPPTDNAPFMKPHNVPEGTFFIAVGAVLGAFGAAILLWRAVVAWQLHRSVKRAAVAQTMSNDKLAFAAPPGPFYKFAEPESDPSLANANAGRGVRRTQRGPIPSSTPSQANLFFSPTAPGANHAGNRESRFLPSGFYAAGAASQQQGHEHSISLTNLRPDSRGYPRAAGQSPPESPGLAPRADPSRRNVSRSTLDLNPPAGERAPSAYLDDLLADQPERFPPPRQNPS
ncbi:hypothetical protein DL766_000936 [Monosporascus sp. MC13-8B]|uniref:Mid2 domain-containing protein n=1 Tax=Monosporascus cannonballus TaxID=155416 RepID=A0ABY0HFI9_9PEZI|nr:hypothetical protein DL762_003322 [Monosporascus cannonballus]RYP00735.1 hypothetical protein DL763_000615 [Monosporascus cannonballus]RYP38519.1 hypothetical protein DL766_000936 [Monosporascus sp. MC13-8B]